MTYATNDEHNLPHLLVPSSLPSSLPSSVRPARPAWRVRPAPAYPLEAGLTLARFSRALGIGTDRKAVASLTFLHRLPLSKKERRRAPALALATREKPHLVFGT